MVDTPASFDNVPEIDFTPTDRIPKMGKGTFVRYRPDHKSFGRFIKSEQMRDVTAEVAKDIAARAGQLAPRRKHGVVPDGEAMADSFKVNREAGRLKVARNVRVMVHVYNNKRSAAPMEFGNEHVKKPHRMLGRAGAEFGDFHSGKSDLPEEI